MQPNPNSSPSPKPDPALICPYAQPCPHLPTQVLLPLLAGQGSEDLPLVAAKATLGFGSVIALGWFVLRRVFQARAEPCRRAAEPPEHAGLGGGLSPGDGPNPTPSHRPDIDPNQVVASTKSGTTFVAATLLVAVGMGIAAEALGLSSSTGAFAAGVLLAGTNYRAQARARPRAPSPHASVSLPHLIASHRL